MPMSETYNIYNKKLEPIVSHWWQTRGKAWATEHGVFFEHSPQFEAFATLIGDPMCENRQYIVDVTKQRVRNLIDTLDSPYQPTLFKILQLRHEETHNAHPNLKDTKNI